MPPRKPAAAQSAADYRHDDTRLNNPPAGIADVNPLPPARKRYDYDGATFLVRQAYFPSQTPNPREKISKALKGSVDPDQFAALQRTSSLYFKAGKHKQCAVKVIDHRGNEVMTVLPLQ